MRRAAGEPDDGPSVADVRMTVHEMRAVRGIGWDGDLDAIREDPIESIESIEPGDNRL